MNDQLQVNFRMPAALKTRLETSAQKSGRSLTAEIVQRLQDSFAYGVDPSTTIDEALLGPVEPEQELALHIGMVAMLARNLSRAAGQLREMQEDVTGVRLVSSDDILQATGQDVDEKVAKQQKGMLEDARRATGRDALEAVGKIVKRKGRAK